MPLRIAFVAPFGLRPKSTARGRALPLAGALAALGHQVRLFIPPWDDRASSGQSFDHRGVWVEQLVLPPSPILDVPLLTARLVMALRQWQPDIIHVFKPKAYSGFVQMAAHTPFLRWRRDDNLHVLLDTDDWEGRGGWNDFAPYSFWQKALFAQQEQWGLRHHDGITVASRTLETIVLSMGVPPRKVLYLPNGPGEGWPAPEPSAVAETATRLGLADHPVALLYTRFFEFDEQILAQRWAQVVAALPSARLLVVGQGLAGEELKFQAALRRLEVADTVVDVGWLPFEQLPTHLALATCALYPMRDDLLNRAKCPLKLADLLYLGIPVVGEAVGQVREYLAEGAGVLVAPEDDGAFVRAIVSLLQNPDQAATIAAAARHRVQTVFAWQRAAQSYLDWLNK